MSVEVEIKARANLLAVHKKLAAMGKRWSHHAFKADIYYTSDREGLRDRPVRVRVERAQAERILVTAKNKTIYEGIETSREIEFAAEPRESIESFLAWLGYKPSSTKSKFSVVYPWKDGISVELNEVDHLGGFVEVEALLPNESTWEDIERARAEVLVVLKTLEIDEAFIEHRTYNELLRQEMPLEEGRKG